MNAAPVTTLRLYGAALAVAVASFLLGLPAVALAHLAGPDASVAVLLVASLPALLPAIGAGWWLPSRWAAAVAGAVGVSCASFFTTAPALDVAFTGPMFDAAAMGLSPDALPPVLAATMEGVVVGGWGFAWFVALAGALLGAGAAWARGTEAGRLTSTEAPTVAVLALALTMVLEASSLDALSTSMDALTGVGFRLGVGLHQLATATLCGALTAYVVGRPSSVAGWLAAVALVGVGGAGIVLAALVAPSVLPWLAAGWLLGLVLGGWATGGVLVAPTNDLQHGLGEAIGVGLSLPFVLSASGVGVGLAAALGAVQLLQPVDAAGVPVDLVAVAHDVLYGRTMAWVVLLAGIGHFVVVTPIRMLASKGS